MSTGTLTVSGNVSGSPVGARTINMNIITASAVDATQVLTLSIGANTVTVPAGATLCVIAGPNAVSPIPNPNYGGVLTVKGVAGDTGVAMSAKWPTVLSWDVGAAPASFVINATVGCTIELWFM